jgi:hypothetical protein
MRLRRIESGTYQTADGRFNIERQENDAECSHPLCATLHADRQWTGDLPGHTVTTIDWIVWDNEADDYAGSHETFVSKRAATVWLERYLDSQAVTS